MNCTVVIRSGMPRALLEERLAALASGGPFHIAGLACSGPEQWTFRLLPLRPGMAIGFVKVAELLVLVAREFDVDSVYRLAGSGFAVAS